MYCTSSTSLAPACQGRQAEAPASCTYSTNTQHKVMSSQQQQLLRIRDVVAHVQGFSCLPCWSHVWFWLMLPCVCWNACDQLGTPLLWASPHSACSVGCVSAAAAGFVLCQHNVLTVRELLSVLQGVEGYSSICLMTDKTKPHIGAMYQVGSIWTIRSGFSIGVVCLQ